MTVNTLTLYMPGSSVGIQVYEGSQLHLILVSQGASFTPSAPVATPRADPFPQYVDNDELAAVLAGFDGGGGGGGAVDSVNGQAGVVVLDADDIGDSATRKLMTSDERDKLADISPGANIYTDEQVRDVIGTALVAGTNVTITPNDPADTITISATGGSGSTVGAERNIAADGATTGAANNATIIQAAIDAVATAGGGTVVIPKGTWNTGPLRLKTRVRLRGEGWGSTLKLINGANAHMITLDTAGVMQAAVEDLRLDGNGANQTSGNILHFDHTGFDNTGTQPIFDDDPNLLVRRVALINADGHGYYSTGVRGGTQLVHVYAFDNGSCGFRADSPDNMFDHCVAGNNGNQGFMTAGNGSNVRFVGCKSFLSGRVGGSDAGFHLEFTSRNDLIGCEAQDNRGHGFVVVGGTQHSITGRADRNGLGPEPVVGNAADGIFVQGTVDSTFDLIIGDRGSSDGTNPGAMLQRYGYNCGSGNDGNIVRLSIAASKSGTAGVGSWGANSVVTILFEGAVASGRAVTQLFTASGTWTKPDGATSVSVRVIGAGGGGGSGRRGATGTIRGGGSGGGGGGVTERVIPAGVLGATEAVTVGTGGSGGTSQTTNDTNGGSGATGGTSSFGAWARAIGGGAGNQGFAGSANGGTAGTGSATSTAGASSSATGAAGTAATAPASGAPGGAGGGGITTADAASAGGTGAAPATLSGMTNGASGAAGAPGGAGVGATASAALPGASGGGGGGGHTTNAGSGGAGAIYGAGGGGGGGSTNGFASGAGGAGGAGAVLVTTYF